MFSLLKRQRADDIPQQQWYADYVNELALLLNAPAQTESLLYNLQQVARGISLYVKTKKTKFMCFKQKGAISTLSGKTLILEKQFTYLGRSISSTESNVNIRLAKVWTAILRLTILWKCKIR